MKNSFILYQDNAEIFNALTKEQAGELIQAIFAYEATGVGPEFTDQVLRVAFIPIKQSLDRNLDKYTEKVERLKANVGKKTNRNDIEESKHDIEENKNDIEENKNDIEENKNDIESVNVNDSVNDNDSEKDKNPPNPPSGGTGEKILKISKAQKEKNECRAIRDSFVFETRLNNTVNDWIKYKHEKGKAYKPVGFKSLLSEIRNNANTYGNEAVIQAINQSMASNYQGIVWEKLERGGQKYDKPSGAVKEFRAKPTYGTVV